MRTLAVDGTRIVLPNHPSVKKQFGVHHFGPNADSERSMAIGSMLYDVLNEVTIDAQLAPYSSSEIYLLEQHLSKINKGDLLLLDRGYPSIWLIFLLFGKGIEFTMRIQVKAFTESNEKQAIVEFTLPQKDKAKLADYPELVDATIACRLVKVELEDGNIEILCSSLTDIEKYKHEEFKALYHLRWNEEEAYKLLKNRIEIEDFSGKTARAIKQDFHAKIFLLSLTAIYAHPIAEQVKQDFSIAKGLKHDQQINRTNAITMAIDILPALFIMNRKVKIAFEAFDDIVYNTREIIRPNRSIERKHRQKKRYASAYKRL